MCELSYTSYKNCGCARVHATLPCVTAFNPSQPQCELMDYMQAEEVEGDCPECKPAFDNKSGLEPHNTLDFTTETLSPPRVIMQEVQDVQLKGTLAEINRKHDQFRYLDEEEREDHKYQLFLDWLDDPDHAGPREDDLEECELAWCRVKREAARTGRAGCEDDMGKITPPPPTTPSTTTPHAISADVRGEYTLKARHHVLTADQRGAMRRRGRGNIRRLTVVSRRRHDNDTSSSDQDAPAPYGRTLSKAQRARLRRGYAVRLSAVGRRRCGRVY